MKNEQRVTEGAALFRRVTEPYIEAGEVERGTIMGRPCVRTAGEFVAMPYDATGALVVKLDAARVAELIDEGTGTPFVPANRVFREWVAIDRRDDALWTRLFEEALAAARRRTRG